MRQRSRIILYAPSAAITARPDLLDRVAERYDLRSVIIRSPDRTAFELVRERDLDALWLAPGLWGDGQQPATNRAVFPSVPGWDASLHPAYERQFPMQCPNSPGFAGELGAYYAQTANALGATGVFATHQRYHHPANLEHLWGCICPNCWVTAAQTGLDVGEISNFWRALAHKLAKLPAEQWAQVPVMASTNPLIDWWAALTDMDFPLRWFAWKNTSIESHMLRVRAAFEAGAPKLTFAANCFEPLLAPLVGNAPTTQRSSIWYAPLLGYWSHHVHGSLENLAAWHLILSSQGTRDSILQALATLLGVGAALNDAAHGIRQELYLGAAQAAQLGMEYYPVLNGTIANQYGGTASQFSLAEGLDLAERLGAAGVIVQGISQLLDDALLDFWY